jgi:hypothetical protein
MLSWFGTPDLAVELYFMTRPSLQKTNKHKPEMKKSNGSEKLKNLTYKRTRRDVHLEILDYYCSEYFFPCFLKVIREL